MNSPAIDTRPKNYIGSTLLFIGIFVSATIIGILLITGMLVSFEYRTRIGRIWCYVIAWMTRVFCGLTYEIEGMENIHPEQAAIIFSNHQSAWETLALRSFLPTHSAVIKKELLYLPIWGWSLLTLKSIVIDRKKTTASLRSLISNGSRYLNEGIWVLIFPEGTRSAAGEVQSFTIGGSMLAHKTGFPVVPVAHNAGVYWPRYSFFKYPGVIKVKIGPAIPTKGRKASEINAEAENWIREAVKSMPH